MCLIELESDNPDFSYVIFKNPSSGMQLKAIRKGTAYAWYPPNQTNRYLIYFADGYDEISYKENKDQIFDYLNKLRYNSPLFVLNSLSEFFKSTLKQVQQKDRGSNNSFKSYNVQIKPSALKVMQRLQLFFPGFTISVDQKASENYEITISNGNTIYELLNCVTVYFGLIGSLNDQDFDLMENSIERLIEAVNIIQAPYYLRYIINSRILTSQKLFTKLGPQLETPNIKLKYGTTAIQRRNHIKSLLNFDRTIVDIGCGEGCYALPYGKLLDQRNKEARYYAIDINEAELEKVRGKAEKKELTNIITLSSYHDLCLSEESCDIILTEVIEHMEPEESETMIRWVLENLNFNKIIITTPNFDFNKYYNLDTFRHPDHHWEPSSIEFKNFIEPIIKDYKIIYLEIGDRVDGISCSQGVLIQKC
jgi:hypothetical protein